MKKAIIYPWVIIFICAARSVWAATVGGLLCEERVNPLGIDMSQPRFSWLIASDRRGEVQTGYQVLVASTAELLAADQGDLWDSGRVASDATVQVVYCGHGLKSSAKYFWKVRVWDRDGKPSAWSDPAFFSMGLMASSDCTALWISDPILADPANRPLQPTNCYRSELAGNADAGKWIVLDLGSVKSMDAVEIMPARPARQNKDFRTAMFPVRFKVEAAQGRDFANAKLLVNNTDADFPSPRKESCRFEFPTTRARYIRLTITKLPRWDGTDYGIALGGLAVFDGPQSVSTGAGVDCSDSIESAFSSKRFLVQEKPAVKLVDSPALDAGMADTTKKFTVSRVPMLRREFKLAANVKRATLSASARGFYELRINGKKVSDDVLTPGFTDYAARLQCQTYDVTSLLNKGDNAISALLGYGWYAGHMNLFEMRCIYGYFPQVLAQLDVELSDGTRVSVVTDGQWRSTLDGPVRWSDLLDGEGYDCNREMPGWDQSGFDDRGWKAAWSQPRDGVPLVWDRCQPVRAIGDIPPVNVREIAAGVYVFDFGQEFTGWCRLKTDGPAGTHVRLRHAEMVKADGSIDTQSLMGTQQRDDYILDGKGERTFEPRFTYHGFRYVELSGLPGKLKPDTLIGVNLRTDARITGQFECSNELYNRIQKAADWTQANLLFDVPAGCAARSERLAWMGDIRPCVKSLLFNFDSVPLLTKYVSDITDDQLTDGRFTDIAPHAHLTGTTVAVGTPGWGDAGVSLPWDLYVNTGDTRMLAGQYEAARRWVEFIHANNPDLIWRHMRGESWGDWLSAGTPVTPMDLGSTAFFAHSVDVVSHMAKALGRKDDAEKYRQLFQDIRRNFAKTYVSEKGIIADPAGKPAPSRDVAATVRSLHKDGRLSFVVTNEALGGDPAPNHVKILRLVVQKGGKPEQRDFAEKSQVSIADGADGALQILSASYGVNPDEEGDAQGSYALALHFDLLDEPLRALAAKRLDQLVIKNQFHPTTGFWSSIELLLALSDNGFHDDAAEMVNQHEAPSWGNMAEFNTTLWESFDADRRKISLDHWPHSAISQWLWNNVAGLKVDEENPGFQSFIVFPRPSKEVSWCKADYDSARGRISIHWSLSGGNFTMAVVVPPNCRATVYLPANGVGSITESGQAVERSAGVRLLRNENARVVLQVDSGSYNFACAASK